MGYIISEIVWWIIGEVLGRLTNTPKRLLQALVGIVAGVLTSSISFFVLPLFLPRQFIGFSSYSVNLVSILLMIVIFASIGGAIGGLIGGSLVQDRGERAQIICAAITGGITAFLLGGCCSWYVTNLI